METGVNLRAWFHSELEMAKFDNTLVRAVAKNAVKAMNMYNVKCEALVSSVWQCWFAICLKGMLTSHL
jgi:hypothetical protein